MIPPRFLSPVWPLVLALGLAPACLHAGAGAARAAADRAWARGDLESALTGYTQALEEGQADAAAYYGQALCLQRLGRLREAAASLREALRLDPDVDPEGRLGTALDSQLQVQAGLALCQAADQDRRLGRLDQAERGYFLALRLDPDCAEARRGLAALRWRRGDLSEAWQGAAQAPRAAPDSAQAQGLQAVLAAARGVQAGGLTAGALKDDSAAWGAFLRAGLQQGARSGPGGDQALTDALLFGRLERRTSAWRAAYSYFLDAGRSSTGTARVDYHALALDWTPQGSVWNLQLDEALEWSQGQLAYGHHLAELRRSWRTGRWRGWSGLQLLWENYPRAAEMDAFGPSLAEGLSHRLPWDGHLGLEIRLRADDTQGWAQRDAGMSCHAVLAWRSGKNFSPRVDLDAKALSFPDWPGTPGRWDRSVDLRAELALWQDGRCQISAGDEVWRHVSSVADYSEVGNSVFAAGTLFW